MKKESLTFGLPKGSLQAPTEEILEKIGIKTPKDRRALKKIQGLGIFNQILLVRPQIVPFLVSESILKAGICGLDCLEESGLVKKNEIIAELNYSKILKSPVKIVIFGKNPDLIDEVNVIVYAEYPNLAKRVFRQARVIESPGATESLVVAHKENKIIYGVGVVETGQSLKENGLVIVKEILSSPAVLLAKKKTEEIDLFGRLLSGVLAASDMRLVKMNASIYSLEKIIKVLPAMKAPTISQLTDGSYALETAIEKSNLVATLIAIKKLGARDILVQDVNVVLP